MQNQSYNHNVLDTGRIGSLLMKLSAPMFFGMFIQNIYNIVDTIFVGRYVGTEGLAAISIIMPLQMLVFGTSNMFSIGGASLISRLIGQREKEKAERALGNSLFFAVLFSVVLTLVIIVFVNFWLKLIGTSESLMPYARDYLMITIAGTVFNITGMVLLSLVRAEGNARVSMVSMVLQSLLNIALDAIFMIPLKMGISGAALAMVVSQFVSLIYVLSYYLAHNSYLKLSWRNFIPEGKIVKDIFAIGMSQVFMTFATAIAALTLVRMVSTYGGDDALSAFGIGQRILTFASMPSNVLSQAMQPILGFNYGSKRFRQALKSINLTVLISGGVGLAILALLVAIPGPIIRIFTSDPKLIAVSINASKIMFLGLPLYSIFNVGQMAFPSIGKVWPTMIISTIRPLLFLTPIALFLPHFIGINGVWTSFPGSDTLGFLLVLWFLIPLLRQFRKAIADQKLAAPALVPAEEQASATD